MDFEGGYLDTQAQAGLRVPFNLEAEQSVLGAVLLDSSCLPVVAEMLPRAEFFYGETNRQVYEAVLEMFTLGQPVDFVTVLEKLREFEGFDQEAGKVYLAQLVQIVPSISNVEAYAKIVRDKYDIRTLMQAARGILDDASEGAEESSLLLDAAEQRIFDIRQGKSTQGLQAVREILLDTFDRLDRLNSADKDKYRGLPTGIGELDTVITGLNRSDLVILAARPGMGKTSFGLNISRHISVTAGRTGDLSNEEWARLIEAGDILSRANLYFDDSPGVTVPEMKAKVRRLKDVDVVIVDYLQLMNSPKRIDNRVQEISEITRSLKLMAKDLNIPVVAMAQLSRANTQRADKTPMLSDLRDSGAIEQDADIVLMFHRENYYQTGMEPPGEDADQNECQIIVAKNRHGETKTIPVHWQGEFMRFTAREVIRHE